jgi:hypothetical protein
VPDRDCRQYHGRHKEALRGQECIGLRVAFCAVRDENLVETGDPVMLELRSRPRRSGKLRKEFDVPKTNPLFTHSNCEKGCTGG